MSLLTLCQKAARKLALDVPSAIVGSTNAQTLLLLEMAQDEGKALAKRHTWQALTAEKTFVTIAAAAQTTSIPSDFRTLINESIFNRTRNRRVAGPIAPEEWQLIQSSLVTRVDPAYRIRGDVMLLTPTPPAGETVAYEYISKNWCQSSGGTAQSEWLADTDTGKLDEDVMALGVEWRFRSNRGIEFSDLQLEYERQVTDLIIRDGSRKRLSMVSCTSDRIPTAPQVPETLVF